MKKVFSRTVFSLMLVLSLSMTASFAQDELPYRNPELPVEERVEDLLARMTLDEKIEQMTLVEKNSIRPQHITDLAIGGLLSGGGGYPSNNTPEGWAEMVNGFQARALASRLGIPLIYGVDAVHGHNNVRGAVIFPHNIGLGATGDAELVEQIGRVTALEMIATGIYWNYAPVVAVAQDIRWGRIYESYSENTDLVTDLATAYLRGLQGESLSGALSVLATPKHYVGDGGAVWGTSTRYFIDQGVTDVDEETLRAVHLPPYEAAVEAGAMSIMISFSSWGGMKMHAQHYLITDVLKGELGFAGFVVSDWAGMDHISTDYYQAMVTGINAGVDMNMVPYNYGRFIQVMQQAVENGDITEARIDDAVRRILRAKFALGLFEHPFGDETLLGSVGSDEHRALARRAVSQSLVLLQNENDTLPLSKDVPTLFVAGPSANDIGLQCGGWTIEWQGSFGEITPGTTILQGIFETLGNHTMLYYHPYGDFTEAVDDSGNPIRADVGIVVIGEPPYAEGVGDAADLGLSGAAVQLIEQVGERSEKLIVILVSGRPLIITEELGLADAWVAAWLPGTEGQGVADVLFGDQPFTGKLSFRWPRSMDQLHDDPLFPFGYGLTTNPVRGILLGHPCDE